MHITQGSFYIGNCLDEAEVIALAQWIAWQEAAQQTSEQATDQRFPSQAADRPFTQTAIAE